MTSLPFLQGYPPEILNRAQGLLERGELLGRVTQRYPEAHQVHSNKELFRYVQELKARHMKTAAPLAKVTYDSHLHSVHNALGLHVTSAVVHGSRLRKRRELRVAALFKDVPAAFLRMIVIHELAHMKHSDHDRAFYKLCCFMEPEYHQLELDLRLYLTALDSSAACD
jgi:predicted metal-dependent hydrolase